MESAGYANIPKAEEAVSPRERVTGLAHDAAAIVREEFGDDARVIWFGSWPRGTARWNSDIDLAIVPARHVSVSDWGRLRGRIEDLRTLYTFDLVDLTEASDELRRDVEDHGQAL